MKEETLVELLERRFVTADGVIVWNEQVKGLIDGAINRVSKNIDQPVVISHSYSEKELADMVHYCIQKIDIGLLNSEEDFHRIVAIKHHIRNWKTLQQ